MSAERRIDIGVGGLGIAREKGSRCNLHAALTAVAPDCFSSTT